MAQSNEEELLKKRFIELAKKSEEHGYFLFTDFLGLSELSVFAEAKAAIGSVHYSAFGGADGTERVMLRFGSSEELGYEQPFPISIIKAEPKSAKFADKLTHRDFLGSLMNLGIERSCLGDIVIIDNVGYIFAKEDIAEYLASSLTKVRHTDIRAAITDTLPEGRLFKTEISRIQLSSERIDAVISKVYSISRDDSLSLFKKGVVFIDGKRCENNSRTPKNNELISVRGYGRFIYRGAVGLSKKGKINVEIEKYVS